MQLTQHIALLVSVAAHALQNIRQLCDRLSDEWALIEHDALGTLCPGGVRDLGSGRKTRFRQTLKDLGGPDSWHVRSLAEPQYFLLQLGHSRESGLDGKVSSGDHDSDVVPPHRFQQDP